MVYSKPITPPLLLEHHSAAAHYSLQPQYGRLSNSQESAVKMSISIIFLNLLSFFQLLSSTVKISISASHCQGLDLQLVDAINPRGLPLYNKNCNVMALWHFDFLCSMTVVLQFSSDSLAVNQLEIERKKEKSQLIVVVPWTAPLFGLLWFDHLIWRRLYIYYRICIFRHTAKGVHNPNYCWYKVHFYEFFLHIPSTYGN